MTVRWGRPTGEARGSPEPRDHPPHRQANLRARDRRRAGACGCAAGGRCLGGGDRCLTHSAHARPWLHPPADTGGHPRGRYAPGARLNVLGGLRIVIAARRHSLRRARRTGLLLAVTLPLRGKRSSLGSPSRHCRFGRTGAVPFGLQSMAADTPRSTVVGMIRPRCAGGRPHRDAARAGARWRWAASPRPVDSTPVVAAPSTAQVACDGLYGAALPGLLEGVELNTHTLSTGPDLPHPVRNVRGHVS